MSRRTHNRGSVLLMTVGLLTIIALLGGAFLIVAGLNRRVAASYASQGRMALAAKGKLLEVGTLLAKDTPLNTWGTTTPVQKTIETLGNITYDTHLLPYDPTSMVVAPPGTNPVSSQPYPGAVVQSEILDSAGKQYKVGYRVIDASGMLNINYAEKPAAPQLGVPMPISNLSLQKYFSDGTLASSIHSAAVAAPFMMDDWLSFLGSPAPAITATGRVKRIMASTPFTNVGGLTVRSSSPYSLLPGQCSTGYTLTEKVDLNTASQAVLVKAFYDLLSGYPSTSTPNRLAVATSLALRVVDFRSAASAIPTCATVTPFTGVNASVQVNYFGLKRQPFITKAAFYRLQADTTKDRYAIELFNPYTSTITMTGCKVASWADSTAFTTLPGTLSDSFDLSIPPGSKVILASHSDGLALNGATAIVVKRATLPTLNLTNYATAILWENGGNFPVGLVWASDFSAPTPDATWDATPDRMGVLRRDDRLANAAYTVRLYVEDRAATTGNPSNAAAGLGLLNASSTSGNVSTGFTIPHPVYIRNGNFISVGDLMRIYYMPVSIYPNGSNPMPLDTAMALPVVSGDRADVGLLPMNDGTPAHSLSNPSSNYLINPMVPHGCKATEYFMVGGATNIDTTNKLVYGQVNINTCSQKVMACLPGIAGFADADTKAATLIAARPYYTAGHIAKAIMANAGMAATAYGTGDTNAYALGSGNDDGLSTASGSAVLADLTKKLSAYAWMSNHITVRSNVFVVYVQVQEGSASGATQNYVGVIDRSMVKTVSDKPTVLMFSPIN